MAELQVMALSHIYSKGTPFEQTALRDVTLTIPQGQLVVSQEKRVRENPV